MRQEIIQSRQAGFGNNPGSIEPCAESIAGLPKAGMDPDIKRLNTGIR